MLLCVFYIMRVLIDAFARMCAKAAVKCARVRVSLRVSVSV
jgi:hypothetical protein